MAQIINKTVIYARIILPFLPRIILPFLLGSAAWLGHVQAQNVPQPDRERLLNGLTILYGNRPGDPNVLLKLRIQSGAVFDLAGRAGMMALLADAMFPESTTREYVADQLGGRLDVSTSYDVIDVTLSGKATELERMIELLRNALVNLNLSPENVATVRSARIKELTEKRSSMAETANRAVAARLFGTYPYANPPEGSVETVAKIERGDLMLARDRFLNADNAALVAIGGVDKARLMRTVRQLLGPWQKSDRIVPATFRQPGTVDNRVALIDQPGVKNAEVRLAVRGLARSDRDAPAASLLAMIIKQRWQSAESDLSSTVVAHQAYALNGMFMLAASVPVSSAAKAIASARATVHALANQAPTAAEVETAKNTITAKSSSPAESIADAWLDAETYKLPATSPAAELNNISTADIKRVAARLFGETANQAVVVMGNASELKSQFGDQIEPPANLAKPSSNPSLPLKKP
jgi:predicted Zn-dependent peptidase